MYNSKITNLKTDSYIFLTLLSMRQCSVALAYLAILNLGLHLLVIFLGVPVGGAD